VFPHLFVSLSVELDELLVRGDDSVAADFALQRACTRVGVWIRGGLRGAVYIHHMIGPNPRPIRNARQLVVRRLSKSLIDDSLSRGVLKCGCGYKLRLRDRAAPPQPWPAPQQRPNN